MNTIFTSNSTITCAEYNENRIFIWKIRASIQRNENWKL